jgi:hypothetical protein
VRIRVRVRVRVRVRARVSFSFISSACNSKLTCPFSPNLNLAPNPNPKSRPEYTRNGRSRKIALTAAKHMHPSNYT